MGTFRSALASRRRRSALLLAGGALLLLAAALTLPGRGGGERVDRLTKPAYERAVRDAYADVQEAFAATHVRSPEELPARVAAAEASLRRAAATLGALRPPARVEAEHATLVAGLSAYAAELGRGLERPALASEAVEAIAESAERMKLKGYDLGRIAKE